MKPSKLKNPTVQVLIAISLGISLGLFSRSPLGAGSFDPATLGQVGMVLIRFLKALALPLIFFAVADAIVRTNLAQKSGIRFLVICLINVSVASGIALTLINFLHPGTKWQGHIEELLRLVGSGSVATHIAPEKTKLDWIQGLSSLFPQHLLDPIQTGNILATVILAALVGISVRSLSTSTVGEERRAIEFVASALTGGFLVFSRILRFAIQLAPLAILALVTQAVGKLGLGIFLDLSDYLLIVMLGLLLQGLIYYPLAAFVAGGRSPMAFLRGASEAAWTGFAVNSSLATVPVSLKCLKQMQVDDQSARISVCGGTNFNNDGVVLYEVMTALFLAQSMGMVLDLPQQLVIASSSIIAAAGIAGVPEAGLVILPIVLANSGFSEAVIAAAIPLVSPIDWILARCRSGVNVLGDILGATILARWNQRTENLKKS
ncbi:MAG TPA: dicarboxylate/amino acid:cation symporter [Methylococcaceae bacterium]|jgi:Na+/H+-dicarboxylate symporter|nr:dicarboxylate/amino acid:cation symporter [Methylococcaceae bacterium]